MTGKSPASVSLDLDNLWVYLKVHGDPRWEALPNYIPQFVPRALEFFRERSLRITFFVVGQDAEIGENRKPLQAILADGHEIANHSFSHNTWMGQSAPEEAEREIVRAEEAIEAAVGVRPIGYRGPGFSATEHLMRTLASRGYQYDASLFPSFIGPLARLYYFATSSMSRGEKQKRKDLFGSARAGLLPLRPFIWDLGGGAALAEIPVTTMPIFKLPIHLSYVMYLAQYSTAAAAGYFRFALWLCRRLDIPPSLLLHPLDFMTAGEAPDLAFFPGMKVGIERKLKTIDSICEAIRKEHDPLPLGEQARALNSPPAGRLSAKRLNR